MHLSNLTQKNCVEKKFGKKNWAWYNKKKFRKKIGLGITTKKFGKKIGLGITKILKYFNTCSCLNIWMT